MYNDNKTLEHQRNANGNVSFSKEPKERTYGGLAKFLGGMATSLALMFALSALLLHTAIQTNAGNEMKIRELERTTSEQRYAIETARNNALNDAQFSPALTETMIHVEPTPSQIQPEPTKIEPLAEAHDPMPTHNYYIEHTTPANTAEQIHEMICPYCE